MLAIIFGAERFRTYIYSRSFTIISDHKPLESISQRNLGDMPAWLQHMLLHLQGYDYTICYCPSKEMALPHALSLTSVHVLALTSHWTLPFIMLTCPQSGRKHFNKPSWVILRCMPLPTSSSPVGHMTSRRFLTPCILTGNIMRPSPSKMALSAVEKSCCSSFRKGENTTPTTLVPSRNHQIPVAHMWMYLLAWYKQSHWRSCSSVWDLHLVPSPECCNTSHSYTNSVPPMANVCLRHLYPGRSWLPHMQWLLLKDDPHLSSSIWPEQHHQSHLAAQGNVFRAWNLRGPLLWQWSSIC